MPEILLTPPHSGLQPGDVVTDFQDLDDVELPQPGDDDFVAPVEVVDTHHDRINISTETVLAAAAAYPPEHANLVVWAHKYAREHRWSLHVAQRQFKISSTVLSRVWQGRYCQPPRIRPPGAPKGKKVNLIPNPIAGQPVALDSFCKKIELYKSIADQRGADTRLPFVETSTFRKIRHLCETTLVSVDLSQLIGESQIGKSRAFQELARRNTNIIHVQTPAAASSGEFVFAVGAAMNIGPCNQFRMKSRIKARLNSETLLVLDRLHFIFETYTEFQALRVLAIIQEIFDDTGCALVISATKVFLRKVQREKFVETFKQISRRGIRVLDLGTEPAAEDIDAVLAHYGLTLPPAASPLIAGKEKQHDVRQVIRHLSTNSGLGKMSRYLADAARVAQQKREPLTWDRFIGHYDINERAGKGVKS